MSEQIISKTCRACKQTKSISEFYKNSDHLDGHLNICKICQRTYQKRYQQSEKSKVVRKRHQQSEKYKVTTKRYVQSENFKVAQKHYQQSEKGKTAIKHRRQSEKFKTAAKHYKQSEKGKAATKRFNIRHPKQSKAKHAVEKAIRDGRLARPGSLQCHYCPAQAKEYHHYKGYAPEHWLDVIPVCIPCHNKIPKKQAISASV